VKPEPIDIRKRHLKDFLQDQTAWVEHACAVPEIAGTNEEKTLRESLLNLNNSADVLTMIFDDYEAMASGRPQKHPVRETYISLLVSLGAVWQISQRVVDSPTGKLLKRCGAAKAREQRTFHTADRIILEQAQRELRKHPTATANHIAEAITESVNSSLGDFSFDNERGFHKVDIAQDFWIINNIEGRFINRARLPLHERIAHQILSITRHEIEDVIDQLRSVFNSKCIAKAGKARQTIRADGAYFAIDNTVSK